MNEQTNFNDYLSVDYNFGLAIFSDVQIIKGSIKNSATIAKFKDIVLTITFFSETNTELDSKDFVIYKFFEPNSEVNFEIRTEYPNATSKIGVTIKSVVPVD